MAGPDVETARSTLFARLFGIAVIAHVVGNWSQPDFPAPVGWANLAVGLAGLWLSTRPSRKVLLLASGLVVTSVLLEIPVTGNHWLVAGLVAAAILATRGNQERWVPAARVILLVFYSFAAFAKLNSGFFDPTVSCAVFYANQSLGAVGLPLLDPAATVSRAIIWATVAIECSVPIALIWRRTRYIGVVLGTVFHTFISYDLSQHFYDFTAVLIALFVLFLPDRSVERITGRLARAGDRMGLAGTAVVGMVGALVVIAATPMNPTVAVLLTRIAFFLWVALSIPWLVILIGGRSAADRLTWNPGIAGAVVVALTLLNGLTPYTEVKTAYSFNMYANLLTSQGDSNHYLIQATFPLRDGYDGSVEILDSSDQGLVAYRDEGYLVAYPQLRRYLSSRPDVSLTYRRFGEITALPTVASFPELVDPGPWWWRFFPLRAIDTMNPPRCQAAFLGAL